MQSLKIPRRVALAVVSTLVTLGVIVSFMESYRALYWWSSNHQVHGTWAILWPIQVDAFVAVGELALFVALTDFWKPRHRSLPWLITAAGLLVSVAGNVGHLTTHNPFDRLTAAVPPLTAYVMLAAGLGILKRVIAYQPKAPERKKPGPKPGTPRTRKAVAADPEEAVKAEAFKTLPTDDRLYRPLVAGNGGGKAPQMPADWDPDSTNAFPRLDTEGHPVNGSKAA